MEKEKKYEEESSGHFEFAMMFFREKIETVWE